MIQRKHHGIMCALALAGTLGWGASPSMRTTTRMGARCS